MEIFGIVAEHLIGQHAFGTAASLNIASRSVRSETSPALWESVTFRSRVCDTWEDTPPANLRYTKYVPELSSRLDSTNCRNSHRFIFFLNRSFEQSLRDAMPKVVMAVSISKAHVGDICTLQIHRPITLNTVLRILHTPIEHGPPRQEHEKCSSFYGPSRRSRPGDIRPDCANFRPKCKSLYRPVEKIHRVVLEGDGRIHGNSSIHRPSTTTSVMLSQTEIIFETPPGDRSAIVDTAIRLLHIAVHQTNPSHFADQDREAIGAGHVECLFAHKFTPWHLKQALHEEDVDGFVKQVRMSRLKRDSGGFQFLLLLAADRRLGSPRTIDSTKPHHAWDRSL